MAEDKLRLPLDKDYVNSLDLPTLTRMLPMYESKHKKGKIKPKTKYTDYEA